MFGLSKQLTLEKLLGSSIQFSDECKNLLEGIFGVVTSKYKKEGNQVCHGTLDVKKLFEDGLMYLSMNLVNEENKEKKPIEK